MKQRVTLTLDANAVSYLDEVAEREQRNRSVIVDAILANFIREQRQAELARQAAAFFAPPEGTAEAEERADWERLGLEVVRRES